MRQKVIIYFYVLGEREHYNFNLQAYLPKELIFGTICRAKNDPPATKIPLWPVAARIVRSRIILPLVCYGFIGANSNSMNSIRRAASSGC